MTKLLLAFLLCSPLFAQSERDLINSLESSTVTIYAEDDEGNLACDCTGTVVGNPSPSNYVLLTASHCIKHEEEETFNYYVATDDKQFFKLEEYKTGTMDYALLKFQSGKKFPVFPMGDERREYDGAPIVNVNSRKGLGLQVEHGFISKVKVDRPIKEEANDWRGHILLQLSASGGSSGSAVVSLSQRAIVGIVVGVINTDHTPVAVAVPASKINMNPSEVDMKALAKEIDSELKKIQ